MKPLLSICIPSYNRPEQLGKLLSTIDGDSGSLEIVICEDRAPRRAEVRETVEGFMKTSRYKVVYKENEINLGYDGNFRRLIEVATGSFLLFLGDDDWFSPGALDRYLAFLKENPDVGYVLRAHYAMHPDGEIEAFRYHPGPRRFAPGLDTCVWLYKRTVSIGGITFKRESALKHATERFDGTLLYQCHLVLEIALHEETVYSDIPVVVAWQSFREDNANHGAASADKGRYVPGTITPDNSINFSKGFFEIAKAFDAAHGSSVTKAIREDLSKYSYPFLSIQRKRGALEFVKYAIRLARETGLNATWYYYLYALGLLVLGERACDKIILAIKRKLGYTPRL